MKRLTPLLFIPFLFIGCEALNDDGTDDADDYRPDGPVLNYSPQYKVIGLKSECSKQRKGSNLFML